MTTISDNSGSILPAVPGADRPPLYTGAATEFAGKLTIQGLQQPMYLAQSTTDGSSGQPSENLQAAGNTPGPPPLSPVEQRDLGYFNGSERVREELVNLFSEYGWASHYSSDQIKTHSDRIVARNRVQQLSDAFYWNYPVQHAVNLYMSALAEQHQAVVKYNQNFLPTFREQMLAGEDAVALIGKGALLTPTTDDTEFDNAFRQLTGVSTLALKQGGINSGIGYLGFHAEAYHRYKQGMRETGIVPDQWVPFGNIPGPYTGSDMRSIPVEYFGRLIPIPEPLYFFIDPTNDELYRHATPAEAAALIQGYEDDGRYPLGLEAYNQTFDFGFIEIREGKAQVMYGKDPGLHSKVRLGLDQAFSEVINTNLPLEQRVKAAITFRLLANLTHAYWRGNVPISTNAGVGLLAMLGVPSGPEAPHFEVRALMHGSRGDTNLKSFIEQETRAAMQRYNALQGNAPETVSSDLSQNAASGLPQITEAELRDSFSQSLQARGIDPDQIWYSNADNPGPVDAEYFPKQTAAINSLRTEVYEQVRQQIENGYLPVLIFDIDGVTNTEEGFWLNQADYERDPTPTLQRVRSIHSFTPIVIQSMIDTVQGLDAAGAEIYHLTGRPWREMDGVYASFAANGLGNAKVGSSEDGGKAHHRQQILEQADALARERGLKGAVLVATVGDRIGDHPGPDENSKLLNPDSRIIVRTPSAHTSKSDFIVISPEQYAESPQPLSHWGLESGAEQSQASAGETNNDPNGQGGTTNSLSDQVSSESSNALAKDYEGFAESNGLFNLTDQQANTGYTNFSLHKKIERGPGTIGVAPYDLPALLSGQADDLTSPIETGEGQATQTEYIPAQIAPATFNPKSTTPAEPSLEQTVRNAYSQLPAAVQVTLTLEEFRQLDLTEIDLAQQYKDYTGLHSNVTHQDDKPPMRLADYIKFGPEIQQRLQQWSDQAKRSDVTVSTYQKQTQIYRDQAESLQQVTQQIQQATAELKAAQSAKPTQSTERITMPLRYPAAQMIQRQGVETGNVGNNIVNTTKTGAPIGEKINTNVRMISLKGKTGLDQYTQSNTIPKYLYKPDQQGQLQLYMVKESGNQLSLQAVPLSVHKPQVSMGTHYTSQRGWLNIPQLSATQQSQINQYLQQSNFMVPSPVMAPTAPAGSNAPAPVSVPVP